MQRLWERASAVAAAGQRCHAAARIGVLSRMLHKLLHKIDSIAKTENIYLFMCIIIAKIEIMEYTRVRREINYEYHWIQD